MQRIHIINLSSISSSSENIYQGKRMLLLHYCYLAVLYIYKCYIGEHFENIILEGFIEEIKTESVVPSDGKRMTAQYECQNKSSIYCSGILLDTVQKAEIYIDSKTFVDMPMKHNPAKVSENFKQLYDMSWGKPSKQQLKTFLDENFNKVGHELEYHSLVDWVESPPVLKRITNQTIKQWAQDINQIWKQLGRKINDRVNEYPDRTSLIYVPNPFVIPGDRFREYYYWDSYWIINGLLVSDMTQTVRGMIENFFTIVDKYGMIPNGGRIYYTKRSQPPFLTPMVDSYYGKTQDFSFIEENIHLLDKEYQFWLTEHTREYKDPHTKKVYNLSYYKQENAAPRPEGYVQDLKLVEDLEEGDASFLYTAIASACESGWDFSTRWFKDYSNKQAMFTHHIAPVDLNSLLAWNEQILAKFHEMLGNKERMEFYQHQHDMRLSAINELMWNEEIGSWFDLDMQDGTQRAQYYISNFVPLFTKCYDLTRTETIVHKALAYLKQEKVLDFPGGVPNSMKTDSGEQWDFPSAWPPSIHMLIEGLSQTGIKEAVSLATELAQKWLRCNYLGWKNHSAMFEKYSVLECGVPGGGGEYDVQTGFGWTNGVVMMLLDKYADIVNVQ